ncbi:uncharacterized protein BDW43DRAFT_317176 [Aspergillus alliaceus]|uniref:uncharacterized protein n=1 Tax=Petromyces alliaceus TaxID=209559 RepID=UPI0012A564AF|nr:uncharacterized protein BDW43DRAFT_317176 [Aspergillus alliaceus]KAB8227060.1 hypothetical protein BDW43DRAFT_317176 [Aspergillus alliaceus]
MAPSRDAELELVLKPELLQGMSTWTLLDDLPSYHHLVLPIIQGHNVLAQGPFHLKRMYLLVSALQRISTGAMPVAQSQCQALIVCPTFELAWTVKGIAKMLASAMPSVEIYCCPRGFHDAQDKIDELQGSGTGRVPDIVVGTAGRIWECITRGWLKTDTVTMLVFEGMDDIMNLGYDESVLQGILDTVAPGGTQLVVQSDSLHVWRSIWKLVGGFMPSPVRMWNI